MDLYDAVITDADEIYTYFEVIRQLSPLRILDVGMMLKRMGTVSRQAMHCEISQAVRLDGVDFYPEAELPIYHAVYDHICSVEQLPDEVYNLSVCLGLFSGNFQENSVTKQWISSKTNLEYLYAHSSAVLFDAKAKVAADFFKARCACQLLQSGNRAFILAHPKAV